MRKGLTETATAIVFWRQIAFVSTLVGVEWDAYELKVTHISLKWCVQIRWEIDDVHYFIQVHIHAYFFSRWESTPALHNARWPMGGSSFRRASASHVHGITETARFKEPNTRNKTAKTKKKDLKNMNRCDDDKAQTQETNDRRLSISMHVLVSLPFIKKILIKIFPTYMYVSWGSNTIACCVFAQRVTAYFWTEQDWCEKIAYLSSLHKQDNQRARQNSIHLLLRSIPQKSYADRRTILYGALASLLKSDASTTSTLKGPYWLLCVNGCSVTPS